MSALEPSKYFYFIEIVKINDHTIDQIQQIISFEAGSARLVFALYFDISLGFAAYQIFYFTDTIRSYLSWGFTGLNSKPQQLILAKIFDPLYISRTMVSFAFEFV